MLSKQDAINVNDLRLTAKYIFISSHLLYQTILLFRYDWLQKEELMKGKLSKVWLPLMVSGVVLATISVVVVLRTSKPENPFPLSTEVVEKAMEEQSLQWKIGESTSFSDGNVNYEVRNENGKITVFITSTLANNDKGQLSGTVNAANERRFLEVMLLPPTTYESKLTEAITEEQWPAMFDFACSLYGGPRNSKKVYRQFKKATKDEKYEPSKGKKIVWLKKIDGVRYVVSMRPSEKYYGRFDLLSIMLMNDVCYKDYLAAMKRFEEKQAEQEKKKAERSAALSSAGS